MDIGELTMENGESVTMLKDYKQKKQNNYQLSIN